MSYELRLCPNGLYYLYEDNELLIDYIPFNKWNKEAVEILIDKINKLTDENEQLKNAVEFVDKINKMNERRLTRQAKHLEKIYTMIGNKEWDKLTALYIDTKQDYEEII